MKKTIPIYILLLAILGLFGLQLRETRALREELTGIRKEQLKQPTGGRILPVGAGIPVFVTNRPLPVSVER
jgi:hypothetical protein